MVNLSKGHRDVYCTILATLQTASDFSMENFKEREKALNNNLY